MIHYNLLYNVDPKFIEELREHYKKLDLGWLYNIKASDLFEDCIEEPEKPHRAPEGLVVKQSESTWLGLDQVWENFDY